jgi:hypothetical protein
VASVANKFQILGTPIAVLTNPVVLLLNNPLLSLAILTVVGCSCSPADLLGRAQMVLVDGAIEDVVVGGLLVLRIVYLFLQNTAPPQVLAVLVLLRRLVAHSPHTEDGLVEKVFLLAL